MIRYGIAALVVAVLGYMGYSTYQSRLENELKQASIEAQEKEQFRLIRKMAHETNAVTDWQKNIIGNKTRKYRLLTVELQKQWISNRPILFIGNLVDIISNKDDMYHQIIAVQNFFPFRLNELQIRLDCPAQVTEPLLQFFKESSLKTVKNNVAISAFIERIETTVTDNATVMTGFGKCVSVMPLAKPVLETDLPPFS